jgi:O-antigen/teichoic acid export membrane protein
MLKIIYQTITTAITRIFGSLSGFILNIVIANVLEPKHAGELFILLSLATFIGQLATFGMGNSLLKEIGIYKGKDEYKSINNFCSHVVYITLIISILLSCFLMACSDVINNYFFQNNLTSSLISGVAFSIPFISLLSISMAAFQSIGKPSIGLFVQSCLQPGLFALCCYIFANDVGLAVGYFVTSCFVSVIVALFFWGKQKHIKFNIVKYFWIKKVLRSSFSFFPIVVIGIFLVHAPILVTAKFFSPSDVAYVAVATKVAGLLSFVLVTCNMVLSPHISSSYNKGEMKDLKVYSQVSAVFMLILASPLLAIVLIFPSWILQLFGSDYVNAKSFLIVLSIGQFIKLSVGSVGALLMMTGAHRSFNILQLFNLFVFCCIAYVGGVFYSSPIIIVLGISVGVALQHIAAVIIVKKHLGFYSFPSRDGFFMLSELLFKKSNV